MRSAFEYLLNALERAAQAEQPAAEGVGEKRKAVIRHVEQLDGALRDYRARLIAVHALIGEPVTAKNLLDARVLIEPFFLDALRDVKALRGADRIVSRTMSASDRETA